MATLSGILDYGYIVAADDDLGALVTWNGSATFNFWVGSATDWKNTDCRTIDEIETLAAAEKEAKGWLDNPNGDPACDGCGDLFVEDDLPNGKCQDCTDKEGK
jgi:hypothetical protein